MAKGKKERHRRPPLPLQGGARTRWMAAAMRALRVAWPAKRRPGASPAGAAAAADGPAPSPCLPASKGAAAPPRTCSPSSGTSGTGGSAAAWVGTQDLRLFRRPTSATWAAVIILQAMPGDSFQPHWPPAPSLSGAHPTNAARVATHTCSMLSSSTPERGRCESQSRRRRVRIPGGRPNCSTNARA